MSRTVRFADGFDGPDVIAFGLAAPQLLIVVAGAAITYLALQLGLPLPLRMPLAVVVAGSSAALGWGRLQQRPMLAWAVAGGHFAMAPRRRTFILQAQAEDELPADIAGQPWARWLRRPESDGSGSAPGDPEPVVPAPLESADPVMPDQASSGIKSVPTAARLKVAEPEAPVEDLDDEPVILPFARAFADDVDEIDIPAEPGASVELAPPVAAAADSPVFVGATRRVTFFALNGGTGRSTLATEVAGLLAARGRHSRDGVSSQPLKVALLDLDLRSATVAVRLGIPHPTVWDFVVNEHDGAENLDGYMVSHRSGLRALLGPPKPVSDGRGIEPSRIAEIVHQLESDGYHFIIFDVSADLSAVTTWVLGAVHDIFVVLTPTASGIQDAYRTTEALRRMGLRHKLAYVVNRSRAGFELGEVMRDLGGRVLASIPYDTAIEDAENAHRLVATDGVGAAATAIASLAAHLYPPLQAAPLRRRMQLPWRRHAG